MALEIDVEHIIDKVGVGHLLQVMASICHEKADHLVTNWQDYPAARKWDRLGKRLYNLGHVVKRDYQL